MTSAPRPPRLARAIVWMASASEDRGLVLADLAERFEAIVHATGPSAARRWYWFQAVRALPSALRPDPDLWSRRSWNGTLGDVRRSLRALVRRPLYALGVSGTLALGLASAASVGAVAWHVWLAPMDFPDPARVVRLFEVEPDEAASAARAASTRGSSSTEPAEWRISPPLLADLRTHDWATMETVAGVSSNDFDWTREGRTTRLLSLVVSPELFDILGMAPILGRPLSRDEDADEVVLTEAFWARVFGRDPAVIGAGSLTLSGTPYRIVGVVRPPAGYPGDGEVFTRLSFAEQQLSEGMRGARYLDVVARVRPEHTVSDAAAEMDRFVSSLGATYPQHDGWSGTAVRLSDELLEPYRGVLALLLSAGVVFMLLAVVNVAGLAAARTVEGRHDRAVRLALGASEGRLLRASWAESLLLGAAASGIALVGAYAMLGPLTSLVPPEVPRIDQVRLGSGICATVVVFGLLAGWGVGVLGYALSRGVRAEVGRSGRTVAPGLAGRGALVVGQVALTTLLATAGAGVLRQIGSLRAIDMGFRPEGVVASQVTLSAQRYATPGERLTYWRSLIAEARARGLVVAVATNAPMSGMNMSWGFRRDAAAEEAYGQYHPVSTGYFEVMGIDLLEGRTFSDEDREGSSPVLVVNEALARELFPGESAVGRTLTVLNDERTIVGVVRSTRHFGPGGEVPQELYVPMEHDPWPHAQVLVRADDPGAGSQALGTLLADLDPDLGVPSPAPYTRYVADWFATLRLQAIIVGVLAVVGTLLATLGLYALVAYQVGTRRREIGVRMALGASDTRTFSTVTLNGVRLAGLGMAIGFAAWYLSLPLTGGLLGDIDASDPLVPLVVGALVGLVSALASALPAFRSISVDPAITLRAE